MDWSTILVIAITALITAVVSGVVGLVANLIKTKTSGIVVRQQAMERGLQSLLRNELYQVFDKCCAQGYVTPRELSNWDNMYEQYHNLGKNGVMDRYNEEIKKLPIKTKIC